MQVSIFYWCVLNVSQQNRKTFVKQNIFTNLLIFYINILLHKNCTFHWWPSMIWIQLSCKRNCDITWWTVLTSLAWFMMGGIRQQNMVLLHKSGVLSVYCWHGFCFEFLYKFDVCMIEKATVLFICTLKRVKYIVFGVSIKLHALYNIHIIRAINSLSIFFCEMFVYLKRRSNLSITTHLCSCITNDILT